LLPTPSESVNHGAAGVTHDVWARRIRTGPDAARAAWAGTTAEAAVAAVAETVVITSATNTTSAPRLHVAQRFDTGPR
jgi:hypothetical protein